MPSPTSARADSAAIADDLRAVVGRLVRRLRAENAIPPHQFSVLSIIERSGSQTTSQLATLEIVRPQSMAHTVQQLDEAGLITRHPDPSDGRQTLIDLSDYGRTVIDEQRREMTGWLSAAVDAKLEPHERETLTAAISMLNRLLES
jgi:DNA-binding MarR family transcriptional regulator